MGEWGHAENGPPPRFTQIGLSRSSWEASGKLIKLIKYAEQTQLFYKKRKNSFINRYNCSRGGLHLEPRGKSRSIAASSHNRRLQQHWVLGFSLCVTQCACVWAPEGAGVCVCVVPQRRCWWYGGPLSVQASLRTITGRVNVCFPSFPSGSWGTAAFHHFIFIKEEKRRRERGRKKAPLL